MGILKYILEGEQKVLEIKYVPVSIVYDLIPDVKEMTEEGKGKGKQSENLALFGRYLKNLGHKYGRASIRFGAPVDVSEHKNASFQTTKTKAMPIKINYLVLLLNSFIRPILLLL